jgi:hypothetical protein
VATNPSECGDMIGLIERAKSNEILLFPNPFQESLTIRLVENSSIRRIDFMTVGGQLTLSMDNGNNEAELHIDNLGFLPPGLYIVKCLFENGLTRYFKIIKN